MQRINTKNTIPIEKLLDEYDEKQNITQTDKNNIKKEKKQQKIKLALEEQQKKLKEQEQIKKLTLEEENIVTKHFADKLYCDCCSLSEVEILLKREIQPCDGCFCCRMDDFY